MDAINIYFSSVIIKLLIQVGGAPALEAPRQKALLVVRIFGGPTSELRSGGNSREQERAVFLWAWEEVQASIGRDLGAEEERGRRR